MTQTQATAPATSGLAKLPIVYLRGYAGTTDGINATTDDPFYGFNAGATHVRVDGDGDPSYYQFEGPLLRLLTEEGYQLLVHGNQRALLTEDGPQLDPTSIWVHRFYDTAATTFAAPAKANFLERLGNKIHHSVSADHFNIETAATDLYSFIMDIRRRTGAPKVLLVAHSMGGLVARCMIQKICEMPDAAGNGREHAIDIVAKLFTFGTPHGGIVSSSALGNKIEEVFGPAGSEIFSPPRMYGYLTPKAHFDDEPPKDGNWDPRVMPPGVFDVDNIFCIVGTDPSDYGPARLLMGPQSDGLVRMQNAYIKGAHRAYIYKSHSGAYGEVNSEEGYQNLKRFFFGPWAVSLSFAGLPRDEPTTTWQADMRLSIRGLPIIMSEQQSAHWCPIILNKVLAKGTTTSQQDAVQQDQVDAPVPIVSTFLLAPQTTGSGIGAPASAALSRYVVTLKVYEIVEKRGAFDFSDHLEQVGDWADSLVVDVGLDDNGRMAAWTAWNSTILGSISSVSKMPTALVLTEDAALPGQHVGTVLLPESAKSLPIFGPNASVRVTVKHRSA